MQANTLHLQQPWIIDSRLLHPQTWLHLAVVAALLISILAPIPPTGRAPHTNNDIAGRAEADLPTFPQALTSATAAAPAPTTWQGHAELIKRRDAFTRYYDLGDGKGAALVATTPQHFANASGQWANADPR